MKLFYVAGGGRELEFIPEDLGYRVLGVGIRGLYAHEGRRPLS